METVVIGYQRQPDELCELLLLTTTNGILQQLTSVSRGLYAYSFGRRRMAAEPKLGSPQSQIVDQYTTSRRKRMAVTPDYVREVFKGLENGDGAAFFKHVADDVDWTVMGTHPLAGRYGSKADFIAGTFTKLGQVLPKGTQLHLEYLIVNGDQAVVELHSLATARNGMRFDNRYCWILFFEADKIVRVRAYLDSALVAKLFKENPVAA
jgi:hypothetical protein